MISQKVLEKVKELIRVYAEEEGLERPLSADETLKLKEKYIDYNEGNRGCTK